jgi:UDP-2,3-diacylglucosamine pyrophosphatase LpxH
MQQFLKKILTQPTITLVDKLSSRPDKKRVDHSLSELYTDINANPGKKGLALRFDVAADKFIILSDQHKGVNNGADIFASAENNYLAALKYYHDNGFFYVNLGDSEELWENTIKTVKKHHKKTFEAEKHFLTKDSFIKIFGNHDLYWDNSPLAEMNLEKIYGQKVTIYEGLILKCANSKVPLEIYMTHGHQGDLQSDGNWFSKWFVANVWERFQAYLRINPNTPANNDELKTAHNKMMYQWSSKQKNTLLITGHTHQPVFKSFTQLEKLYNELQTAKKSKDKTAVSELQKQIKHRENKGDKVPNFTGYLDTYFNSGCCCFDDGDITGIELSEGSIRLIKWQYGNNKTSERLILEESKLEDLKIG